MYKTDFSVTKLRCSYSGFTSSHENHWTLPCW